MRRRMMMVYEGENMRILKGSFTPTENTTEWTIELERECQNFIFQKESETLNYGVRTYLAGSCITDMWQEILTTNAAGTGAMLAFEGGVTPNGIKIDGKVVVIQGHPTYMPGNLVPEKYNWIAW